MGNFLRHAGVLSVLAGDFEKASRLMFEIQTGFYQLKVNKLFIALARARGF
ncbi:hypothetical protein GCM10010937_27600 [Gluconobacter japonicus]|uniref:Uncharacterized protein n=1 Tax=Gluconobacter japonicus TaxID=376620 RepID=A0ABQ5WLV4_GLUJA|nr:hypothetical protein AA3271_0275 [Gluconobacter japonicus NBRC 3271]GLQ60957.1 hypothetical protein GCM10010937_27600 [Gluconobacter japonicus]